MQQPHFLVGLVTCLSLLVLLVMLIRVGMARTKHGVEAPAITGNEVFERHYRVQMNTIEALIIHLPVLWLFALYWNDRVAAVLGLIWIVGRILYMLAYVREPKSRGPGYGISSLATLILLIGSIWGAIKGLLVVGI